MEYVNKIFKKGDRVKRITPTRTLISGDTIYEGQEYIVDICITNRYASYIYLVGINGSIGSGTLELVPDKFKVGDTVRRIGHDFEDIRVGEIYTIEKIYNSLVEVHGKPWSLELSKFELVSCCISPASVAAATAISIDDSPDLFLKYKIDEMACGNAPCHVTVTEENGVRTAHFPNYSNPNPITVMSDKSFNDYAIEAFMSDPHNREEATNTANVLDTLETNLELVINEISKIRKVITRDKNNLSDAMKYCDIKQITRLIEENPAVKEFVERFMENTLVSLVPPQEKVSANIADKFK